MHIANVAFAIEGLLGQTITSYAKHPGSWDENSITNGILASLSRRTDLVYDFNGIATRIDWAGYKLHQTHEHNYGDIGILVNITHKDGYTVEGVAFVEAKKRKWNTARFDELSKEDYGQLKRILRYAPRSMVLMYDYQDVTQSVTSKMQPNIWVNTYEIHGITLSPIYSVIAPSNLICAKRLKTTDKLYRFALPFSYQLVFRYFSGHDLEFDSSKVKLVKEYDSKGRNPAYVLMGKIKKAGSMQELDQSVDIPDSIGDDLYRRVRKQDDRP
ncbi:MAG: hypothetical protein HRF40_05720 [Nitrososphaera sp.]